MGIKKIKILVCPSDKFGVGAFRSLWPHTKLNELYGDQFDVTIDYNPDTSNLSYFDSYDIVHFHKGIGKTVQIFEKIITYLKSKNIITVMDIDDYWDVGQFHPAFITNKKLNLNEIICNNLKMSDYITTTTEIFADEIRKFNQNVMVIPNAIDPNQEQFIPKPKKSKRLRIGLVLGSSHKYDVELLSGMVNKLSHETLNKVQFVLCGFDLRGNIREFDQKTGQIIERPVMPYETVWYDYERILTNNYKIVSNEYRNFLLGFSKDEYLNVENEPYKRCWTKNINEYATHYNDIDVLLAPLKETTFNRYKSQLKAIEAGFFDKAIIAQDFGPYQIDLVSAIEYGGNINPNGNALLVDSRKNHKNWAKYIEKLVECPELLNQLKENLSITIKSKYNLDVVTDLRANFYRTIVEKREKMFS